MAPRKTDPEPFPIRGTPTGYRDTWESDDRALIQAQRAEQERLLAAVRESAAPSRRGKQHTARESCQPAPLADRIETGP